MLVEAVGPCLGWPGWGTHPGGEVLKGGLGGRADDLADLKGARLGHSAFVPGKPKRGRQDGMRVLDPTRCQPGQHGAAQEASRIFNPKDLPGVTNSLSGPGSPEG